MTAASPIFFMAMSTLTSGLLMALYQLHRTRLARERGETSAFGVSRDRTRG